MTSLCLNSLLFVLILSATTSNAADDQSQPDVFPLDVGCEWQYRTGNSLVPRSIQRVSNVEMINGLMLARKETVITGTVTGCERVSCNAKGLFQHQVNEFPIDPPILVLRLPLKDNDQWQSKSKFRKQTIVVDNVSSPDEIQVPLGKLKTVKVESKATIEPDGKVILTTTWFAPRIGIAKLISREAGVAESTTTMELEKFTRKKVLPSDP